MIYRKLQATFGRLENQTLELRPGLNVITCGNESGKSTWAEFISAMLYGVDTRSRARAGELPVKTKYAPWSGSPMEGRIELEKDGRRLVLQRTTVPAGPMAALSVTDADFLPRSFDLQVIFTVPAFLNVTFPVLLTFAIFVLLLFHVNPCAVPSGEAPAFSWYLTVRVFTVFPVIFTPFEFLIVTFSGTRDVPVYFAV